MKIRDRDLILNTAVADSIQGHVGQNTKQVFEVLDGQPFVQEKLKLTGYEFILKDQFGNIYHKMRAVLFDGDLYDVDQWIKPSMMMRTGGGSAYFDDSAARRKLRITEALLKELRETGALALARKNIDIMRGRQLSPAPVALETQDLTHQANVLEDALVAAQKVAEVKPTPVQELDIKGLPGAKKGISLLKLGHPSCPPRDLTEEFGKDLGLTPPEPSIIPAP